MAEELKACEVCKGAGQYRQTYTAGCGFGSYQAMGRCDYCKGTGQRATPPSPSTADMSDQAVFGLLKKAGATEAECRSVYAGHGLTLEWRHITALIRAAVEKDRIERRPRVKLDPELKAALEEAGKTRSTVALLTDGGPVFINYGDQPEDTAHLSCTACGGSGHIDDQNDIAARAALSANAADREAKETAARTLEGIRL